MIPAPLVIFVRVSVCAHSPSGYQWIRSTFGGWQFPDRHNEEFALFSEILKSGALRDPFKNFTPAEGPDSGQTGR